MRHISPLSAAVLLTLAFASCSSDAGSGRASASAVVGSDAAIVTVSAGQVRGVVEGDVMSFKGIPFAAPPLGDLRWRPPQPAQRWDGVFEAVAFKPDCAQEPFPGDAAPLGVPPAEDCLGINVWKPASASQEPLPVLAWIYGGGFVNGGSSPDVYDGSAFARQGVILVSFNYRIGRFGFFAHPALTAEARERGEPLGNYAYLDQIAALEWIRDNIAAFGGDPGNVTIFGESAGGGSVMQLLSTPAAAGLFHKASALSGGGRGSLMGARELDKPGPDGRPSAEAVGLAFAKKNGIEGDGPDALAALRALPAEKLIDGLNMATMGAAGETYVGGPILDGVVVGQTPQQALVSGTWNKVPVLVGATSADIGFNFSPSKDALFAAFGQFAEQARKAYDPDGNGALEAVRWQVGMDQMMIEPPRFVARQATEQGLPAWHYRFSYVAESQRKASPFGAQHATELPFVFNTVQARYGDALTDADREMADAANRYWANFASTGDPNGERLPIWPAYDAEQDVLLDFALDGPKAVRDPWKARLDVTESFFSQQP